MAGEVVVGGVSGGRERVRERRRVCACARALHVRARVTSAF